jgi:TonB family protein
VRRRRFALVFGVIVIMTASLGYGQVTSASTSSDRKVAKQVTPVYPELAKKMHIRGVVRVEATVRPNGSVRATRVLGGNPVLVDAATDSVAKWKFEAAQSETTEIVQVIFGGQ